MSHVECPIKISQNFQLTGVPDGGGVLSDAEKVVSHIYLIVNIPPRVKNRNPLDHMNILAAECRRLQYGRIVGPKSIHNRH